MLTNNFKQNGMKTDSCFVADSHQAAQEEIAVFSSASKTITVSKPVLKEENGMVVLSAEVSGAVSGTCFFSTEQANRDYVDSVSSNCFLIGLLYTAMYAGCDLVLEGAVSEKLLFHMRHYLIPILVDYFEGMLHPINVQAKQLISITRPDADAVGTGFSGGVDSFHTVKEFYLDYDGPAQDKINTILFFNVGSHGMGNSKERLAWLENKFKERKKKLMGYTEAIGLPFVTVNSNVFSFMQSGHLQTCSLATCSAALFLAGKLRLYYIASTGFTYHDFIYLLYKYKDYDIADIDEVVLPHICTESFSVVSGGAACSRTEKTIAICSDSLVQKYLNVCANQKTVTANCTTCYKCIQTIVTLDILGVLDKFSGVFDLKKYTPRTQARYFALVLNKRKQDPYYRDIYELAKEKNFDLYGKTSIPIRLYMSFTETKLYRFLHRLWKE